MIEIVRIFWGTSDQPFSAPASLSIPVEIFGIFYFPSYRLFIIGITLVICIILWIFLEKTNLGLVIRAGTRDPLMVRALGIDMRRIWWLVFGIGSGPGRDWRVFWQHRFEVFFQRWGLPCW